VERHGAGDRCGPVDAVVAAVPQLPLLRFVPRNLGSKARSDSFKNEVGSASTDRRRGHSVPPGESQTQRTREMMCDFNGKRESEFTAV
jgi:hypothetical protein